jgi:hypothetical protein
MQPYEELANAIVLQAVKDYRKALSALRINPKNKAALAEAKECETFFLSSWYRTLTSVDGQMLINKLKSEVAK